MKKTFLLPILLFIFLVSIGTIFHFFANAYIQLNLMFVLVNALLAVGLNLVNGFTGQFSLGHAGFMAVGAYFSAYLSTKWVPTPLPLLNFILYAWISGLISALVGIIVGLPSLRLKGDYLAIVTLGFSEIIRVLLLNTEAVGGARGFYGIPGLNSFFLSYLNGAFWLTCCIVVIWRLVISQHGRAFLSVKEDEVAAQAMGIDTTMVKVRAFILSSFFAGVAGSIFAHYTNYLNPSSFGLLASVNVVIMVVLGGMRSITGSIVAAVIVTLLPELLRPLQEITGVDLRMVIYSLLLILMMILRPSGLFGKNEITDLIRRRG